MNTKTALLITGGVVAASAVVGGIAYYQYIKKNYNVEFQGITATGIKDGNINFDISFLVVNNTGISVTVFNSLFDLYANGVRIGVARQPAPIVVPNKMMTRVVANVIVDKSAIASSLFDFIWGKITGHASQIDAIVQGKLNLRLNVPVLSMFVIGIPVNENYSL